MRTDIVSFSKTMEDIFGELEFEYKLHKKTPLKDLRRISCSKDAFEYIRPVYEKFIYEREVFYVIFLNKANKILGRWKASEGSLEGCIVPINMILNRALLVQAKSIIAVHNHPSGNLNPSDKDLLFSKKLKSAATIMDMNLIDSLILSPDKDYLSLADEGLL